MYKFTKLSLNKFISFLSLNKFISFKKKIILNDATKKVPQLD